MHTIPTGVQLIWLLQEVHVIDSSEQASASHSLPALLMHLQESKFANALKNEILTLVTSSCSCILTPAHMSEHLGVCW